MVMEIQTAATWAMVGVIWFVQVVHYPAYRHVGPEAFVRYQKESTRRTAWVVFPLMMTELAMACGWAWSAFEHVEGRIWAWPGLALLGMIWISTAFVQVPLYARLEGRWDGVAIERLIRSNWLRTIPWTMRGVGVFLWWIAQK